MLQRLDRWQYKIDAFFKMLLLVAAAMALCCLVFAGTLHLLWWMVRTW